MMGEPSDKVLLEFVARFAGWTGDQTVLRHGKIVTVQNPILVNMLAQGPNDSGCREVPDYLNSVDSWLRDVWPKVPEDEALYNKWIIELQFACGHTNLLVKLINADARSRCLALWRALGGKLPD